MFNNSIAGTLPKKLIQPTNIAIAASVLIHCAFLYFGIPYINSELPEENDDPDLTRNVPIIELTPEEQTRLPNLSEQLPEIPVFNQAPDLSQIQGLPSLPPLPPLPPIASSSSWQPIFTPLPPNASIPLPPPPPPMSFPSSVSITLPPPPPLSKLPITKNLPAPPPPLNGEIKPPSLNLPQTFSPQTPTNTQPVEPIQPNQIQPSREQIIARRQQNLLASIDRLGRNLQKDERNTSPEEGNKNYLNWLTRIKTAKPTIANLNGTYPKDACLRKLEGSASYGVLVDTQGKVVETELIRSAGYPILNKQALRDINAQTYINQTGQVQPYQVNVNFERSDRVCPSLGIPRSNKLEPSQSTNNIPSRSPISTPAPQNPGAFKESGTESNITPNPQSDRTPVTSPIPAPVNQNPESNLKPNPQSDRTPVTSSIPAPVDRIPSVNPQLNNTRLQPTIPLNRQTILDRQKILEKQKAIESR
jgi:TonB family protein